mgnify:CR=1 FL=1
MDQPWTEHPFMMNSGELSLLFNSENHLHGASKVVVNGHITITCAQMGNAIRIKCENSCMKIIPVGPNEIIIDPLGNV